MANAQNPGDIKKFSISSNTKEFSIDISPSISEFRYFESVLSNTITATAAVIDTGVVDDKKGGTGSVLDYLPLRGGERADIVVSDYTGNLLVLELYVNRVRNSQPGSRQEIFFIDFVSSQYFANEQYRVTQRFKDAPISTHAQQILGVLQAPVIGMDATAGNYNFYGNDRKPFYILTWLASKAIPSSAGRGSGVGGAAGFMFYQTKGGFHFRSIDSLLRRAPRKKLAFTNTTDLNSNFDGKILKYDINVDVDVQQNLSLGVYKNRTIYYDPLSFSYVVQDFGVDDQNKKIDTAGKRNAAKLINQDLLTTPTRLMTAVLDVGFNQPGTGDQQLETNTDDKESKPNDKTTKNLVQSVMRYNQLFTVQTEITIPGDFDINAGDIVNCTFPDIGRDKKVEINKETSGDYMVAHVCHRTTPRDTYSSLTLVRDSYRAKRK
tara:strand:+ start:522 stop:1826 length:1305 start_codon:yes stop_codon:yes gene_type:complete